MFQRKSKEHKYVKYHSLERSGANSSNYIDIEVSKMIYLASSIYPLSIFHTEVTIEHEGIKQNQI